LPLITILSAGLTTFITDKIISLPISTGDPAGSGLSRVVPLSLVFVATGRFVGKEPFVVIEDWFDEGVVVVLVPPELPRKRKNKTQRLTSNVTLIIPNLELFLESVS
jgi:hypothetical protein